VSSLGGGLSRGAPLQVGQKLLPSKFGGEKRALEWEVVSIGVLLDPTLGRNKGTI